MLRPEDLLHRPTKWNGWLNEGRTEQSIGHLELQGT